LSEKVRDLELSIERSAADKTARIAAEARLKAKVATLEEETERLKVLSQ